MSAIGTGYDLQASQYSPDGRVFQKEYAKKAADFSGTIIAIRGKDGVVIAVEKTIESKLHEPSSNTRLFSIGRHISCGVAGYYPDAFTLVEKARNIAEEFYSNHGSKISVKNLNDSVGRYMFAYTGSPAVRPFGAYMIFASHDEKEGPQLYSTDPAGTSVGYHIIALGRGKQTARSELEKLNYSNMTCRELVKEAARIIYVVHDSSKDKPFSLQLSWVGEHTNRLHQIVPHDIFREAEQYAKDAIAQDTSSDEEMARA